MKLLYLSTAKIPDRRAVSIQQVRMCEAFAEQGVPVQLVHPRYAKDSTSGSIDNWWAFYGVVPKFQLATLPSLQGQRSRHRWLPRGLGAASMLASFAAYFIQQLLTGQLGPDDAVYSRNVYAVRELMLILKALGIRRRPKIAIELHRIDEVQPGWLESVIHHVDLVVTITDQLRQDIAALHKLKVGDIRVEPDGVDLRLFGPTVAQNSDNLSYAPPADYRAIVAYVGHLYEGRGVETLIDCARIMPDVFFLIIGGYPADVARWRDRLTENDHNVDLIGFVAPAQVGRYLATADILVAPYTSQVPTIHYCSPLKLFEYMATRKPIILTDHKVFREVLSDGVSAVFIEEQNPVALKKAILDLLSNPRLAEKLADQAFQTVQRYTWENRARRILSSLLDG